MRIVFMGTPEFAAASLEQLLTTRHEVVGVFTQPDKPKGRGYKLVPPPVQVQSSGASSTEKKRPVSPPCTWARDWTPAI